MYIFVIQLKWMEAGVIGQVMGHVRKLVEVVIKKEADFVSVQLPRMVEVHV